MKLSVVIPAYNEEKDIEAAIRDVDLQLPGSEIIVVNDASTDRTLQILESLDIPNLKILTNGENCGHGYSVTKGLREAKGEYILYIDADRQIQLDNLKQLQGITEGEFDFVSGWRIQRHDKLFRKTISFCLKMTNLFRHGMYIKDANCPFKLYKRSSLQPLLAQLPETYVVPIACLEVMARRRKFKTVTIRTPHKPYDGVRQGFLQFPTLKVWKFCAAAMREVITL